MPSSNKNANLTIKSIRAVGVIAPLARPITTAHATIPAAPLVLIDVICSHDIVGHAYIFGYTPLSLKPLLAMIENLADVLAGQEIAPFKLKQMLDSQFRLLGRQGILGMALSGLDMAFWDALAKQANLSVARMLGGNENPIACYDSFGVFNAKTSPPALERSLAQGFKAVKFKIGGGEIAADVKAVTAIREIIGAETKLMIDYNQSLSAPEAISRIAALRQFDLHWVEEPVLAEDFAGHVRVRQGSGVPIQTGENWWFPEDAARATQAGISDHAMLDIMKIGGVTGWMEAAAIANGASLPISSHIFIEASAHVMAVTPGAHMLEYLDVASAILAEPLEVMDGCVCPRGPGLGIEWHARDVAKMAI